MNQLGHIMGDKDKYKHTGKPTTSFRFVILDLGEVSPPNIQLIEKPVKPVAETVQKIGQQLPLIKGISCPKKCTA